MMNARLKPSLFFIYLFALIVAATTSVQVGHADSTLAENLNLEILKCRNQYDIHQRIIKFVNPDTPPTTFAETRDVDSFCAPDTVYSWVSLNSIRWFEYGQKTDPVSPGKIIYGWRTPIGTFGYEDYSVRIKIKKTAKFKAVRGKIPCAGENPTEEMKDTVWIGLNDQVLEYDFCSMGPIESWSYGQPQHLNEMETEYAWNLGNRSSTLSAYFIAGTYNVFYPVFENSLDGKDFSEIKLQANIEKMRAVVESKKGKIYANQGFDPISRLPVFEEVDPKSPPALKHFTTAKPMFFFFEDKKPGQKMTGLLN